MLFDMLKTPALLICVLATGWLCESVDAASGDALESHVRWAESGGGGSGDSDADGIADAMDNCTQIANPDQIDADMDGFGNRCDADFNNDCQINVLDLAAMRAVFFSADSVVDLNGDAVVNIIDLGILRTLFFSAPGPTGIASICDPLVEPATLLLWANNLETPSDGSRPIFLTANLSTLQGQPIATQVVEFQLDSDAATAQRSITDAFGRATAEFSLGGDPTNRAIQATATAGVTLSSAVVIAVKGSSLRIDGPSYLAQGQSADYTIELTDSGGRGIANESISVTSSSGNALAATNIVTDTTGKAEVQLTAVNVGVDSFAAIGLGEVAAKTVRVAIDTFEFLTPGANAEIEINGAQNVSVRWLRNGQPVVGETVEFASSKGVVTPTAVTTDSGGIATTSISGSNAGQAMVKATATDDVLDTLSVEFVATTPANIDLTTDKATVLASGRSTVTAIVRDAAGNVVKNANVLFSVDDVTAGVLSAPSGVTNSRGQAHVVFHADPIIDSNRTVNVQAVVPQSPALTEDIDLTIAAREVVLMLRTNNLLSQPNPAQRSRLFVVEVTDRGGSSMQGVNVILETVSLRYFQGIYWPFDADDQWQLYSRQSCFDEDSNRNFFLEPGEDFNQNGQLEAGAIATIIPGIQAMNEAGEGVATMLYPVPYGGWVEVELMARASVDGIEYSHREVFVLEALRDDLSFDSGVPGPFIAPPATGFDDLPDAVSLAISASGDRAYSGPFGYSADCAVWDFNN